MNTKKKESFIVFGYVRGVRSWIEWFSCLQVLKWREGRIPNRSLSWVGRSGPWKDLDTPGVTEVYEVPHQSNLLFLDDSGNKNHSIEYWQDWVLESTKRPNHFFAAPRSFPVLCVFPFGHFWPSGCKQSLEASSWKLSTPWDGGHRPLTVPRPFDLEWRRVERVTDRVILEGVKHS